MRRVETTRLTVHPKFAIGEVDPRLFGGFLEHMAAATPTGSCRPPRTTGSPRGTRRLDIRHLIR
jgi:alpha-N-arabinofuranosidase